MWPAFIYPSAPPSDLIDMTRGDPHQSLIIMRRALARDVFLCLRPVPAAPVGSWLLASSFLWGVSRHVGKEALTWQRT